MKLEIENRKLQAVHDFMYELNLVRKKSRERRKFLALLAEHFKKTEEARKEILEEHAYKDEEGNAIIEDDQYKIKDLQAVKEDLAELEKECLVIEGGAHREMLRTLKVIFSDLEEEPFEGEKSEVYDYLYDQLEDQEEKGDE
ncbi:hypothetical protein [Shouchella clausii]|uniref:hypothetical protein n=1 Tax=Shouchella clausii TaxID=79880 RepID=UPI00211C66D4|nr:hypothetical protein [Shouchella clausii]